MVCDCNVEKGEVISMIPISYEHLCARGHKVGASIV